MKSDSVEIREALSARNFVAFGPEIVDTSRTAKSWTMEAI